MKNIKSNYHLVLTFLFTVTAVLAFGQNESETDCFFIQLSDPQFGMFDNNKSFEKETNLFNKAVHEINRLNPDFVVITGDFVHDENADDQINEFKRITAKINPEIPVYYSPGNHDVGRVPNKQSLKEYKKNYGKDRFAFDYKGSRYIGFNTSLIKGKLVKEEAKQFKWLHKQIQNGDNANHVLVFCHYPFYIKNIDEPTAYANIDLEYRKKYLDLFAEYGVDVVFTGHHHNNILNSYKGIDLVTTSAVGKPLGKAASGMRLIKVYENKIEHKYFGLDEIPEIIEF